MGFIKKNLQVGIALAVLCLFVGAIYLADDLKMPGQGTGEGNEKQKGEKTIGKKETPDKSPLAAPFGASGKVTRKKQRGPQRSGKAQLAAALTIMRAQKEGFYPAGSGIDGDSGFGNSQGIGRGNGLTGEGGSPAENTFAPLTGAIGEAGTTTTSSAVTTPRPGTENTKPNPAKIPDKLNLPRLFRRLGQELANLPGQRLLDQETALRMGNPEYFVPSVDPGKAKEDDLPNGSAPEGVELQVGCRVSCAGFLLRCSAGDFLVPSLWSIRQGSVPTREECIQVKFARGEGPPQGYWPGVVGGVYFRNMELPVVFGIGKATFKPSEAATPGK